tara:strand:+ start:1988 stop:2128 length:141 start_codon:yes stop_codon:yes gene_type:complete
MGTYKNLDEVMNFFLRNSTGSVKCEQPDGSIKECFTYIDAEEFFDK